jgi:hypothetical protein
MTGSMSHRRRLWIASVGAGIMAVFVLGYGNQGLESFRLDRATIGGSWLLRFFLTDLNQVAWRLTAPSAAQAQRVWPGLEVTDANHAWIGAIVRDVALIVLAWLLIYVACRGVGAVAARAALFFAAFGAIVATTVICYVAVIPLQFGTRSGGAGMAVFYNNALDAGLVTGAAVGLLVAIVSVLIYRSDPGALASPFAPPFAPPFESSSAPASAPTMAVAPSALPDVFSRRADPDADTLIE